jgi:hypothetical protein
MFHVFDTPCDSIFCLLAVPKCDVGGIEKAMYPVVEWLWELNINILSVTKYDLCEVEKAMFLGYGSPCELIFCFWWALNATLVMSKSDISWGSVSMWTKFVLSACSIKRLGRVQKSGVSRCRMALRSHFCLLGVPKCDLGEVEKAIFQGADRPCEQNFYSLANILWVYFEVRHPRCVSTNSDYKVICIYRQTQLYMRWYAVYYM